MGSITDRKKDAYLPYNMKSTYLSDCFEARIIPFGKYGRFATREVDPAKGTKESLWELAEFESADVIVVGNHGRKGPKHDETVCGTAIEYMAQNQKFPVIIIKDYKPRRVKRDGCLRYGVCYDGSTQSKKAMDLTLNIMKKCDKLAVISIKDTNKLNEDSVRHYAMTEAARYGIEKVEIFVLDQLEGKDTYQTIKHHLKYEASDESKHGYIDFVAIGNGGNALDMNK